MKLALGGLIAVILLGLWVYAVVIGILVVDCATTAGCRTYTVEAYSVGMVQALTLVGSLVSALVIAELAVTKPGEAPMARTLDADATAAQRKSVKWVTALYLAVWTCAGLAAYVFGQMLHPGRLQPLTDLGQSWLGLAVAASYSYFRISPAPKGGSPLGVKGPPQDSVPHGMSEAGFRH